MRQQFSMAKRVLWATAAGFILAAAPVRAADPQVADRAPERYTVQRGDTLWGIAGKFLRDPWRWPDIWRMNREDIKNPHRIYPGDVLVLDRSGATPQLRVETANVRLSPKIRVTPLESESIPSVPPGDIEPFLTQPLITGAEGLVNAAEIVAARDARVVRGQNDIVYVAGIDPASGNLWYIYRPGRVFTTFGSEEVLGHEQRFLGTARVERYAPVSTVRIERATEEIQIGDRLVPAPREQIVNYAPHSPPSAIAGRIIATGRDSVEVGRGGTVTLDKGARDGMDVGSVLAIYRVVPDVADPRPSKEPDQLAGERERTIFFQPDRTLNVPDERTGLMFVFRVFDRLSYALVLSTTDPVLVGDSFRQP